MSVLEMLGNVGLLVLSGAIWTSNPTLVFVAIAIALVLGFGITFISVKEPPLPEPAGKLRLNNPAASAFACRSYGYPGMDLHAGTGWLQITVTRGGYPDIGRAPRSVTVRPGQALYFVSYWSDVTTNAGSCRSFGRVKVTMPNDVSSLVVRASGCADPSSVRVGPVTTTRPAA
jgi:hypothetical protein